MSDVQPYSPGATGTLADVVEQGPELRQLKPAGPDSFSATSGFGELFHANRVQNRAYRTDFDEIMLRDGYAPIVDALGLGQSENPAQFSVSDPNSIGGAAMMDRRPSQLATEAGQGDSLPFGSQRLASRQLQEQLLAARIQARRAKQPNFLPGVPDSVDGLHDYFRQQEEKDRQAASSTIARGSGGLTQAFAGLAGGGTEAFHDPVNIATLALGGGGKTLLQVVGREALVNGVIEAVSLPQAAHNLGELGEHLTAGEAVQDVATSAAFGGLLGAAIHVGATHLPPLLFKAMPESVQVRWADRMKVGDGKAAPLLKDVLSDMDNRELAGFARSTIGTRMTPDERAAADVIERSQELGEGSPFAPGPAGDAAHNANLGATFKAVVDGDPATSPKADLLGSSSPIALRPVAVPRHAGFDAQWSAIKGNEHGIGSHGEFLTSPKGAIGPAQVMPGTAPYAAKLAGVPFDEQRYRTDAAYNEQLGRAYYAEQLQTFGDPAMAAAAYNAGPGSAARGTGLRGALSRAAEHGEPGNWEAYLPHETQRYVDDFRRRTGAVDNGVDRAIASGAGDDEIAGLQRSADDAEAEAIALNRERAPAQDLADRSSIEEVPLLKRELFGSDNEWSDAQAAFHASLNAPEGPPARETVPDAVGGPRPLSGPETAPTAHLAGFDVGGSGRADQIENLEHDIRLQARAESARAAGALLERMQATGKLPKAPKSLLEFISSRGGIEDVNGDLKAMNIELWHRDKPFRRKLLRNRPPHAESGIAYSQKHSPEKLFAAAIDSDYFPELSRNRLAGGTYEDLPDLRTFYEAIDEELRGRPLYTTDDQAALFDRARHEEANAEVGHHLDNLQELAGEWGVALDEGSIEHALDEIARGSAAPDALHTAVEAAAMRDLAAAVADTGNLRYGEDDSGRRWDDEVNYAEHRDPAADDRAPRQGERRSAPNAADQATGRAVAREHEGAAGENASLSERRYQLAPDSEPQALSKILEQLDRERDAVAALRSCAMPGGAA